MENQFCIHCGNKLSANSVFCPSCGQKRRFPEEDTAPPPPPVPQENHVFAETAEPSLPDAPVPAPADNSIAFAPTPEAAPASEPLPEPVEMSAVAPAPSPVPEPTAAPAPEAVFAPAPPPAPAPEGAVYAEPVPAPMVSPAPPAAAFDPSRAPAVAVAVPPAANVQPVPPSPQMMEGESGHKAWKDILTAFLAILLFGASLCFVTLHLARNVLSEQTLRDVVADIDIQTFMDEFELTDLVLANMVPGVAAEYNVKERTILEFLENEDVQATVTELMYDYIEAFISGKKGYTLSVQDVTGFVSDNSAAIEEIFGYRITESDYDEIEDYLKKNKVLDDASPEKLMEEAKLDLEPLRNVLAIMLPLYILSIALGGLLLLSIVLLNRRYCRSIFLATGVTFTAVGAPLSIGALLIPGIFTGLLNVQLMEVLAAVLEAEALFLGLCFLGAGIASLLVFALIKAFTRPKKQAA